MLGILKSFVIEGSDWGISRYRALQKLSGRCYP